MYPRELLSKCVGHPVIVETRLGTTVAGTLLTVTPNMSLEINDAVEVVHSTGVRTERGNVKLTNGVVFTVRLSNAAVAAANLAVM